MSTSTEIVLVVKGFYLKIGYVCKAEISSYPGSCQTSFLRILVMMTSSNGNIFCITGPLCGEFTGPGEFPTQRPVTRSFDVFFDLRLNKRLSKQPWGWRFQTTSWSLRRQCNVIRFSYHITSVYTEWLSILKPASNDFGCICEQIWKEQCRMEAYIAINWAKWYCSKLLIRLVITTKNVYNIRYAT